MLEDVKLILCKDSGFPVKSPPTLVIKYRIGNQLYGQIVHLEDESLNIDEIINTANILLKGALLTLKEVAYGEEE